MDVAIERSTALIDQLLALARYDRDPARLLLNEPVDLWPLAASVWESLAPLAREKRVRLQWSAGQPTLNVRGNPEALAVVLRNLLENALRHAPVGGEMLVEGHADALSHTAEWRVHDNGPGVPAEMRERVFARFFRLERNTSSGVGLGLAIVKRVVEIHGGEVSLGESPQLGGAMVSVRLPLA